MPRRTYSPAVRCAAPRGFTLIEVLVALVILSTGIVSVLRAFETALAASTRGRDSMVATALLRDKLCQVETELLQGGNAETGGTESFVDGANKGFKVRCSVAAADMQGPSLPSECGALYEVRVDVQKASSGTAFSAATYVFVPPGDKSPGKGLP